MSETEHPDSRPLDMPGFGPALLFAMAALSVTLSGSLTADTLGYVLGKAVISFCLAFPVYLGIRFGTARGRGLSGVRRINVLCIAALAMWLLQLLAAVALEHQLRARSAGDPLSLVDPQRAHGKTDRSQLEPVQRVAEPSEEPPIPTVRSADKRLRNHSPSEVDTSASRTPRPEHTRILRDGKPSDEQPHPAQVHQLEQSTDKKPLDQSAGSVEITVGKTPWTDHKPLQLFGIRSDTQPIPAQVGQQQRSAWLLSQVHPDWQQIDKDPRFRAYISTLPEDRRQALVQASNEWDSTVIAVEMTAFKKSISAAQQEASHD